MIQVLDGLPDKVLGFKLIGRLHDDDYDRFVPMVDSAVEQQGTIRMLVEFEDFHGWSAHALWDDLMFAAQHVGDIERIAMVGDKTWEQWMAKVCQPFTRATIRYFDQSHADDARAWIDEGLAPAG